MLEAYHQTQLFPTEFQTHVVSCSFSMTSARKVKPLPNMDENKHRIIDWLGSSHGLPPVKNTISLLKVSDIETAALPFLPATN